jgi:hypothetical protein
MIFMRSLFDDDQRMEEPNEATKEVKPLEKLKNLEDKISVAIERVKTLKEEKGLTDKRIKDLERLLDDKNQEVEMLRAEKNLIKGQLEALLSEIETLESE